MTAALLSLWRDVSILVGEIVLCGSALVSVVWGLLQAADWYSCDGRWKRCETCGQRARRDPSGEDSGRR